MPKFRGPYAAGVPLAIFSTLALIGCQPKPKDCGLADKTEAQCRQELADRGVYCQGALQGVDYVVSGYHNGVIQTLIRFRDGSACLTDKSFDPTSVNGIPAGTNVRVVWSRLPVEKHWCFGADDPRLFKDACGYVQTIVTGGAEAAPR